MVITVLFNREVGRINGPVAKGYEMLTSGPFAQTITSLVCKSLEGKLNFYLRICTVYS